MSGISGQYCIQIGWEPIKGFGWIWQMQSLKRSAKRFDRTIRNKRGTLGLQFVDRENEIPPGKSKVHKATQESVGSKNVGSRMMGNPSLTALECSRSAPT